jgi:hypothetical protein
MNDVTDPTVRHYERTSAELRRKLSSDLDELIANMTPGTVLDEVLSYARSGSVDFLKGLGKSASENPVPILLIGAGTAMFLSGKGRIGDWRNGASRAHDTARQSSGLAERMTEKAARTKQELESAVSAAGVAVAHTAEETATRAKQTTTDALSAVSGAADSVAETAREYAGTARQYAEGAAEAVTSTAKQWGEQSDQLIHDLRDRGNELMREQPLVVGALGLAIGAAMAALLPRTQAEDSAMGEVSDAVKKAVGETTQEELDKAKAVAGRIVEETKSAAQREGLSPEGAVRSVAEKLES